MRIDETPGSAQYTPPVQRAPLDYGQPPPEGGSPRATDGPEADIAVSDQARLLQRAKALAQVAPDSREERVAEIRRQIESGTYQADSRQIAQRILEELVASN